MSLVEYSRKNPGHLARNLLSKMDGAVHRGEEPTEIADRPLAVATTYFVSIMTPMHPTFGMRNTRESRTLCKVLDHLAKAEYGQAADVAAQRLKAVEQAAVDGHWDKAVWLELLPPEKTGLVDRDEERRPGLLGLCPYLHMMIKVDSKSPPAPGRSPRLPHHCLHENMVYVDNHSPSLGGERGPGLLGRFLYFHMIYKVGSKLPPARGR